MCIRDRYFAQSNDPIAQRTRQSATEFEIQMQMALTEHSLFELKQGFTRLDESKIFDEDAFEAVLRTASAMANHSTDAEGFIFFGVADRPQHAKRIVSLYKINPLEVGEFIVTGTEHELAALGRNRDQHMQWLVQRIKKSKLDGAFASQLASTLSVFDYMGYAIWALRPKSMSLPVSWDGNFYIRQGNSTHQLKGTEILELVARFSRK